MSRKLRIKPAAFIASVLFVAGIIFAAGSHWPGSRGTVGHKTHWTKPDNIKDFFEKSFTEIMLREQDNYEYLGNLDDLGIAFQTSTFSNISDKYTAQSYKLYNQFFKELDTYDVSALPKEDKLSYDIYKWFLKDMSDCERFKYHNYIINQLGGPQVALPDFMINTHSITALQDAEAYIVRLGQFEKRFKDIIEESKIREGKGIIPPREMLDKCYLQTTSFSSDAPDKNPLYTTFVERVEAIQGIDSKTKVELCKRCLREISGSVYPAYEKFAVYIKELSKKAPEQGGAWTLPQGNEYYEYMLRHHTTTNLKPDEIHKLGLREVARLQEEMRKIFKELGYEGDSIEEGMQWAGIRGYSSSEVFRVYEDHINRMKGLLPQVFDMAPKAEVTLREVPSFLQSSLPNAYMQATLDGSRPGAFLVNTAIPSYEHSAAPLACHEAIPGHHFQIALQEEMENVPLFRRVPMFTGYVEGWALYAETLGRELGFYESRTAELGYLQSQLHRAARLVMDTGINYKKWTKSQTMTYMQKNVGFVLPSEIDRYIAMPGQACSYMVGELKILELREMAKSQLGNKFNIKEFHKVVLQNGALPMDILENQVKEYIASK